MVTEGEDCEHDRNSEHDRKNLYPPRCIALDCHHINLYLATDFAVGNSGSVVSAPFSSSWATPCACLLHADEKIQPLAFHGYSYRCNVALRSRLLGQFVDHERLAIVSNYFKLVCFPFAHAAPLMS